jgi:RNA polymerase sigma factor FliA
MASRGGKLSEKDVDGCWKRYKERNDDAGRNALIEHYLPLVRLNAERAKAKLPANVDVGDLTSAGYLGLIDAINNFDPDRGVKFETYCSARIRGAMLDDLRGYDWVPRLIRTKANRISRAQAELASRFGREASDEEIAGHLGLSREEYEAQVKEVQVKSQVPIEGAVDGDGEDHDLLRLEMLEDQRNESPLMRLERAELNEVALRGLSDKERLILVTYYYDNLTMKEIGAVLGLSESRVCQIHHQILKVLRDKFTQMDVDFRAA